MTRLKKLALLCLTSLLCSSVIWAQGGNIHLSENINLNLSDALLNSKEQSLDFIKKHYQFPKLDWKLLSKKQDDLEFKHLKFQQIYNGIPVHGGQLILHFNKDGNLYSTGGKFIRIDKIENAFDLTEKEAVDIVLNGYPSNEYYGECNSEFEQNHIEKWIYSDSKTQPTYIYKIDIYSNKPLFRYDVFIDAKTGRDLGRRDKIHMNDVTATGTTMYHGTQSFTTDEISETLYYLRNDVGGGIHTWDYNEGTSTGVEFQDSDNNWTSTANQDNAARDAHWSAEKAYDYFSSTHTYNSFDDADAEINCRVHYGVDYNNAFWNGIELTFGDGDGISYNPLTSIDIVGHELTHGVVQHTADLEYLNESGALNESFADIFGCAIRFYADSANANYLMGDLVSVGSGAFRSLENPNLYNHPDCYNGTNWYTGTLDNGGVHINSGVQNHWFYLLVNGGTGVNDLGNSYNVTGIGMDKASKIAFRNLSTYLTMYSTYTNARTGAIQAAIDLYGACSNEVIQTTNAWRAVGVGLPYQNTISAGFTIDEPISCVLPHTVTFTNTSTNATTYSWSFGDGSTSTLESPSHVYSTTGIYDVTLIVSGSGSCGAGSDTITLSNAIDVSTGTAPAQVAFCNNSFSYFSSYTKVHSFNFADILHNTSLYTSSIGDFTCDYSAELTAGEYYNLEISNGGSNKSVWIDYNNDGTFQSTENIYSSSTGLYTDSVSILINNSTIVYNTPLRMRVVSGYYSSMPEACLSTSNGQQFEYSVTISPNTSPPVVNFQTTGSPNIGAGSQIDFQDLSTGLPTSWQWIFEGGTPNTISVQNPNNITYAAIGTYDVTLIASNSFGSDTLVIPDYITVNNQFNMCATSSSNAPSGILFDSGGETGPYQSNENCSFLINPGCANAITITFSALNLDPYDDYIKIYEGQDNTGALIYSTSFSTVPPPITINANACYIEFNSDYYTNSAGWELSWTSDIPTANPIADFIVADTIPFNHPIQFTDNSSALTQSWSWDFNDGTTSVDQNPLKSFIDTGLFQVELIVDNCFGLDTITKSVFVQSNPILVTLSDSIDVMVSCSDSTTASYMIYNEGSGDLVIDIETGNTINSEDLEILFFQIGSDVNEEYLNVKNIVTDSFPTATISEYSSINTSTFTTSLEGKDILIFPELEDISNYETTHLTQLQPIIQNFVTNGGNVIICGNTPSVINALGFFNTVNSEFEYSAYPLTTIDSNHGWFNGVSLPLNVVSAIYSHEVTTPNFVSLIENDQSYTSLGYLPYGDGFANYIGYDFFQSYIASNIKRTLTNIIRNSNANSWLYADTTTTVSPGDSIEISIDIDASELYAGTYIDSFSISSNDSANALYSVYVNLTVLGESTIDLSANTLDFDTVYQGTNHYDTITISNLGCDSLYIDSILTSNSVFTVTPTNFTIDPYSSSEIYIELYSSSVNTYNDSITLYNSDTIQYISLNAVSIGAPILSFNPDSISVELTSCGDSIVVPLTLYNLGLGDLYGNVNTNAYNNDTLSSLFYDSFEDGDDNNWTSFTYGVQVTDTTASQGSHALQLTSYTQTVRYIEESNPTYFSFQLQQDYYYNSQSRVSLGNAFDYSGVTQIWKYGNYIYFNNYSNSVYVADHSQWIQIELKNIDYINHTYDIYIDNTLTFANALFKNTATDHISRLQLSKSSSSGSISCNFDEITLGEQVSDDFISLNTDSVDILVGDTQIVYVTLYTNGLENGTYNYNLDFETNIPNFPLIQYPIELILSGESEISSNISCIEFDTLLQHQLLESDTLWIYNTGCDTLDISTIAYSSPFYSCSSDTILVNPFDSFPLTISVNDSVVGTNTDTAWFYTTDNDTLSICLNAIIIEAPIISTNPNSISFTLNNCGIDSVIIPYTIYNTGGSDLIVNSGQLPLEDVLANLNSNYLNLTNNIPNFYSFYGGVSGTHIGDGGGDMYDNGNYLNTNLQSYIPYTAGSIVSLPTAFGNNGQYFTSKNTGLFVMAADINSISNFQITGGLGADGSGSTSYGSISTIHNGISFTGYYKKVHSAGDPSVNHLIITETNPSISQTASSNTNIDLHTLTGLTNTTRIYHILFAGALGANYSTSIFQSVMTEFLNLSNSSTILSSTVTPGDSLETEHVIYTSGLTNGTHTSDVVIYSNDPLNPTYSIPVSLTIATPPCILNVEDSIIGCGGSVDFTVEHLNTATSISWDYGDGNTGTGVTSSHVYSSPGLYPIEVITCNSLNCDTFTYNLTITNTSGPIAPICTPGSNYSYSSYGVTFVGLNTISNFSLGTQDGYEDFSCTDSTNLLTGTTYQLNINSGSLSNALYAKAWIDYNNNGTFEFNEVVLDIQNTSSPFTSSISIPTSGVVLNESLRMRVALDRYNSIPNNNPCSVTYGEFEDYSIIIEEPILYPTTAFSYTELNMCDGIIQFNDLTTNNPTNWSWDFGDGTNSSIQNPIHNYSSPGIYDVKLISSNTHGTDSLTQNIIIKIAEANISVGAITGLSAPIQFSNTTTGIIGYNWTFGDGTTSNATLPSHAYSNATTYIVSLEVTNTYGCTATDQVTVDLTEYIGLTEIEEAIVVYPNPARNEVNILNDSSKGMVKVQIINALGQAVLTHIPVDNDKKFSLDTSNLTTGVYTIIFQFNDQSEGYSKLIIE